MTDDAGDPNAFPPTRPTTRRRVGAARGLRGTLQTARGMESAEVDVAYHTLQEGVALAVALLETGDLEEQDRIYAELRRSAGRV
jgi:hypothetical protein